MLTTSAEKTVTEGPTHSRYLENDVYIYVSARFDDELRGQTSDLVNTTASYR